MITLETGRCQQGCEGKYLSITYTNGDHKAGLILRGCGGPYWTEHEGIPGRALRSLREAEEFELPIWGARHLANMQREAERGIARLVRERQITAIEGEAFLAEIFP